MYTTIAADHVGPRPFLCHSCLAGVDGETCACGWTTCACEGCRQHLRLERYAVDEFDHAAERGFLALGCSGGPRPPETVQEAVVKEETAEAPSAEPDAPPAPSVPPTKNATASFRSLLRLCGLSHAEAAVELGQSESSIKKKSSGSLGSTEADMLHLVVVWRRIRNGDVDGLQPGSVEAAAALRALQD